MFKRLGWVAVLAAVVAWPAFSPSGLAQPNPATGARPGNEIGTGSSQPSSDKAQNILPGDTRSDIAPNLPSPSIGDNATPHAYLVAARRALLVGKTGEAQQSLEMAETRALDRSVPLFQTSVPSDSTLVTEIRNALHALGAGDRARSVQLIEAAIKRIEQQK